MFYDDIQFFWHRSIFLEVHRISDSEDPAADTLIVPIQRMNILPITQHKHNSNSYSQNYQVGIPMYLYHLYYMVISFVLDCH